MTTFIPQLPPAVVLLTAQDDEDRILSTLRSIETQAYPATKLVVVTDPCHDRTNDIVRNFASSATCSTFLLTNKEPIGVANSFNRGLLWIVGEAKKALRAEPNMLWAAVHPALIAPAGVALFRSGDMMASNRLLAPMTALSKHTTAHFIYGDAELSAYLPAPRACVSGWTFKLAWLLNLKTPAIFDANSEHADHWDIFVQMLGAGPAVHLEKPLYSAA